MSKEGSVMLEMRHVTKIFNPGTVDEKIALNDLSFTCLLYTSDAADE